jgi:hypothetical protein
MTTVSQEGTCARFLPLALRLFVDSCLILEFPILEAVIGLGPSPPLPRCLLTDPHK